MELEGLQQLNEEESAIDPYRAFRMVYNSIFAGYLQVF